MFLIFIAIQYQEYYVTIYSNSNIVHHDFLRIPDMFCMNYLIESYVE